MIVSCPSCGTLYRYAAAPAVARARCSCCDGSVPVAARRQYAVVASARSETLVAPHELPHAPRPFVAERLSTLRARPAAVEMIGMDDPALAPRLSRTAFDAAPRDAGPAPVMTWTLLAEDVPPPAPRARGTEAAVPPVLESEMRADTAGEAFGDTMVVHEGEGAVRPVLVGVAVGALAGIAGASWFGGSAVSWWAGGALAGAALVLGMRWSWTSRKA